MELILVVVGAIVVTAIAHRRGLEPALVLVVVGFVVSFTPGFEGIELESEVLLSVVLPPLLYSAALDFSFPTFLRNIRPILGLGIGLVVVTAFTVAAVTPLLVPTLTFGTALVLGAVVAPPDAVTAVAVGRKLGLPRKVMAILTGESLVNDAAALSLFSIAVAQIAGTEAYIENPLLLFGYSAVLGPLVGAALGYITLWIRRRLAHPGLETIQGLVVPFAAFISAEHFHASGVLAVVVAGFVVGHGSIESGYQTRLQERYVWNSVDMLLEAFVFAYIGLQLRFVLEELHEAHESLVEVALASLVVLVIILIIRPASVFLMFGRGVLSRKVENKLSVPVPARGGRGALGTRRRGRPRRLRALADDRSLTWQENVVVSWTGMRGVVTLAAASGIPLTTIHGAPFPERATIQAIAFAVSVGTLLLQGLTLPLLIRWLRSSFEHDYSPTPPRRRAEQIVHVAADEVLEEFAENPPQGLDAATLTNIRLTIARHSQDADEMPDPESHTPRAEVFSALYREVLSAQRTALITERDEGRISDEAVRAMLEQARPSGGRCVSAAGEPVLVRRADIESHENAWRNASLRLFAVGRLEASEVPPPKPPPQSPPSPPPQLSPPQPPPSPPPSPPSKPTRHPRQRPVRRRSRRNSRRRNHFRSPGRRSPLRACRRTSHQRAAPSRGPMRPRRGQVSTTARSTSPREPDGRRRGRRGSSSGCAPTGLAMPRFRGLRS